MLGLLGQVITAGAHAVGLATHATPAISNRSLTEFYLTQPAVMLHVLQGPLQFEGMLNLEGLTLRRGELNAGVWGEGYMDRRHPHTFLHEAILTISAAALGSQLSLSAGRGFAPYGTDDPMTRPFVKYPSNHHLSQILERVVISGAVRRGPVMVEAALFNGAEPVDPEDMGDVDSFGDSWSARATLLPRAWLELQASYAEVTSPENIFGGGLDHRLWNASARVERDWRGHSVYALLEVGELAEGRNGLYAYFFDTVLAETAVRRGGWQVAARFERSQRPEEERQLDLFRSVRPAPDNNILGINRFTSGTLQIAHQRKVGRFSLTPFVEVVRTHGEAMEEFPVLPPESLYGKADLWSFSFGVRSIIGAWHKRMGRYGAARNSTAGSHQH
jgi:hypothetical protein